MPHIIVKLWPGKTTEQKTTLCEKITEALIEGKAIKIIKTD